MSSKIIVPIHLCHRLAIVLTLFLYSSLQAKAQSWTADTIKVPFGSITFDNSTFQLCKGKDSREVHPSFISVYERKKGLVFPVDQIVIAEKPLVEHLKIKFSARQKELDVYFPLIARFDIIQTQSLFKREFRLNSAIELWQINSQKDTMLVGTLYHEKIFSQKKKRPVAEGYIQTIDEWASSFQGDVIAVQQEVDLLMPGQLTHFRRGKTTLKPDLYLSGDLFFGVDFWGVDGELWFSNPERGKRYFRTSRLLRYQEHSLVRSVALGNNVDLFNFRFFPNCLFTNKTAFMIGFNNWKDMKTANHKFEEILLFELSAIQKISYNRFDKKGVSAGIGMMESFRYIIHHKPELKIALVLNLAIKL